MSFKLVLSPELAGNHFTDFRETSFSYNLAHHTYNSIYDNQIVAKDDVEVKRKLEHSGTLYHHKILIVEPLDAPEDSTEAALHLYQPP